MKILQINLAYIKGSTGKIVKDLNDQLLKTGNNGYVAYSFGEINTNSIYRVKSKTGYYSSIIKTRMFGRHGFNDRKDTYKLINWIEKIGPDLVHLHNIHGFYINIKILFEYLKKNDIPVVWTLHDCWSVTGHCAYFDYIGCQKWKTCCDHCEQLRSYPITYYDNTKKNYLDKKEIFTSISNKNVRIITPSVWLKGIIEESFLNKYNVDVIPNGIDLNVFKIRESNFRNEYKLEGKKIVLAITYGYNERKGISHLKMLAEILDEVYKIVLVGIEEKDKKKIGENILVLPKIRDQKKLAEIYSVADVYINTTLEEVQGLTNIEALACGTPVITYKSGGSPECIDEKTGAVVEKGDVQAIKKKIEEITLKGKDKFSERCRERAEKFFDKQDMVKNYFNIYKLLLKNRK